jgi:methanogen homoaconitase small subunit
MMNQIIGEALQLKDNINTDDIIAGQYLRTQDSSIWKKHIFETLDLTIASSILEKKFIIAGANFGCGSSREQAVIALKSCGIVAIIAKSYGRIFYRNCINNGLIPALFLNSETLQIEHKQLVLDIEKSYLWVDSNKIALHKIPPFAIQLYDAGGLLQFFKENGKLKTDE